MLSQMHTELPHSFTAHALNVHAVCRGGEEDRGTPRGRNVCVLDSLIYTCWVNRSNGCLLEKLF